MFTRLGRTFSEKKRSGEAPAHIFRWVRNQASPLTAEAECLADEDARRRSRERKAARRAELDEEYVRKFAERIRGLGHELSSLLIGRKTR